MGIKCECDCDFNFRFRHNRCIVALFLTCGFTLSFLSDLDCFFVQVDLDSAADNAVYDSLTFGIGLWSFEDPDVRGKCISPGSVKEIGSLTSQDELYSSFWINGDAYWSAARIVAVVGLAVGFATLVCTRVLLVLILISLTSKKIAIIQIIKVSYTASFLPSVLSFL